MSLISVSSGGMQQKKKFLSIGTNSETKMKEKEKHRGKISLLNLHTTMTLCIVSYSGHRKKKPQKLLFLQQPKMIDLCVVES